MSMYLTEFIWMFINANDFPYYHLSATYKVVKYPQGNERKVRAPIKLEWDNPEGRALNNSVFYWKNQVIFFTYSKFPCPCKC